jgi:hypothetical protein
VITHVVLMKFKAENKDEVIEEALARLHGMVGKVPSLRALEAGRHVGAPDRAFDLGLVTRFDDLEALGAYAVDPVHVAVKSWLFQRLEQSVVVDFAERAAT